MKINTWVSTLSPGLKNLFYSCETALIVAVVLVLTQLSTALLSDQGINGLNWHGLVRAFAISIATGVLKAVIDYLKGISPPLSKEPTP